MKKNLRTMMLSSCAVLIFCASHSFGQAKVGGYKSVPTDDAAVIETAEFAANTQSDRTKQTINIEIIKKASRQVVAGTNYRICMQVAIGEENEKPSVQFVQTTVYQNLQRQFTLKSWTKISSCN